MAVAVGEVQLGGLVNHICATRPARLTLFLLVGADIVLILANLIFVALYMFGIFVEKQPLLLIFDENSLGSGFTYLKWIFLSGAFAVISWRERSLVFAVLTALFAYVFLDDKLEWHEQAGIWLAERLELGTILGIMPESVGQLLFFGAIGAVFFILLSIALLASPGRLRRLALGVMIGLGVLAVFGVGVDALHAIVEVRETTLVQQIVDVSLAIFEDGGEMIVGSLLCVYAVWILASALPETRAGTDSN